MGMVDFAGNLFVLPVLWRARRAECASRLFASSTVVAPGSHALRGLDCQSLRTRAVSFASLEGVLALRAFAEARFRQLSGGLGKPFMFAMSGKVTSSRLHCASRLYYPSLSCGCMLTAGERQLLVVLRVQNRTSAGTVPELTLRAK